MLFEVICMFDDCNSLITLNIPNLNTEKNIIDMTCMFDKCNSLIYKIVKNFE